MAIEKKTRNNFASIIGSPDHDTEWNECDFGGRFYNVKFIVATAALEVSLNGKDVHMELPIGVHDFDKIQLSKIFIRKTASVVKIYAYSND